jgi:hypothetical protein
MAIGKILGDLISPVTDLIGKAVVDKDQARALQFEVQKLADQADARIHEQLMGQIEVNKVEAAHSSVFVSGWRPFVGWISGVGLGYSAIVEPMLRFAAKLNGYTGEFPVIDTNLLMIVLTGMLGVAGMRTVEKYHGTARASLKEPIPKIKK